MSAQRWGLLNSDDAAISGEGERLPEQPRPTPLAAFCSKVQRQFTPLEYRVKDPADGGPADMVKRPVLSRDLDRQRHGGPEREGCAVLHWATIHEQSCGMPLPRPVLAPGAGPGPTQVKVRRKTMPCCLVATGSCSGASSATLPMTSTARSSGGPCGYPLSPTLGRPCAPGSGTAPASAMPAAWAASGASGASSASSAAFPPAASPRRPPMCGGAGSPVLFGLRQSPRVGLHERVLVAPCYASPLRIGVQASTAGSQSSAVPELHAVFTRGHR